MRRYPDRGPVSKIERVNNSGDVVIILSDDEAFALCRALKYPLDNYSIYM